MRSPFRISECVFRVLCLALLLIGSLSAADVNSLPEPTGYVDDFANVVDAGSKQQLEDLCTRIDHELGVQLAFVTVDTVGDRPIEDFALNLGRKWKIGDKNTRQGALVLFAVKDHKDDVEVERGLEPYVTDGDAGSILRGARPLLRSGDYGAAMLQVAQQIAAQIAQAKNVTFDAGSPPPVRQVQHVQRRQNAFPFKAILIILAIIFLFGRRGGGGWWIFPFLGGGWGGGGGWGSGGGWGGGNDSGDSGGGGFGGFGGGGDFGGGGANSDW